MSHSHTRTFLLAGSLLLSASCAPKVEPADLVLEHGKIVTLEQTQPRAEALAVRQGAIVALGSDQEIGPYIGEQTRVIDLEGATAIPGFIEGHGHFMGIGQARLSLDLTRARNWGEIVQMVADAVARAKPGEWILGRGWHQEKWDKAPPGAIEGLPQHGSLSRVSPRNPVLLTHASGHALFANARAMRLAGVTRRTPDPEGGQIVRDRRGRPTGVFRETAQGLIRRALAKDRSGRSPSQVEEEMRRQAELAFQEVLSKGITSFQDAGSSFSTIDFFRKLEAEGKLPLHLWVMVRDSNEALAARLDQYRQVKPRGALTVRAIKRAIDGALGSHGAWLLEPYSDMPSSRGLNTASIDSITETARLAARHGYQLCVHAIGDRANREVLDIYQKIFKTLPDSRNLRWRIEHAQHLDPADIPRFARLGVIASMQGIHCTSDGPWVIERLGEERARRGAYVWKTLLDSGAVVSNGTDAPVEDVDPIQCYYATVSRRMKNGKRFFPEQRLGREEALGTYTLGAAYAAFEEKVKGSLAPGKLADITVLSQDILSIPEEEIPATRVLYTIVAGQVRYQAP